MRVQKTQAKKMHTQTGASKLQASKVAGEGSRDAGADVDRGDEGAGAEWCGGGRGVRREGAQASAPARVTAQRRLFRLPCVLVGSWLSGTMRNSFCD